MWRTYVMSKYGLLSYNSINIGDEIQSIAASRFIPQVDYYINREKLSLFNARSEKRGIKLIMNAWYMWRPNRFIPPETIEPLLISMCIGKNIQNKSFLNSRTKKFLVKNGPVGCRDLRTMDFLHKNGIPAFFSGCLTTTLIGGERRPQNYILCFDVNDEIVKHVETKAHCPVYNLSKFLSPYVNSCNRFKMAKAILYLIRDAKSIITTNFHTALPAMAFGTPCCLIKPDDDGGDFEGRIMGYEKIISAYTKEEFFLGNAFDINNPIPVSQPKEFLEMKSKLEVAVRSFTKFDSAKPIFEDNYNPLVELVECLKYDKKDVNRVLMYANRLNLLKTALKRFLGCNYLDLNR